MRAGPSLPKIAEIQTAVAKHYGMPVDWMREPAPTSRAFRNGYDASRPRQTAMALADLLTEHSRANIGRYFGGRDPTTVLHAARAVARRRKTDAALDETMKRLSLELVMRGGGQAL